MGKPRLSFWQIWNMSFGFLGIQFGFALQGGFMTSIFQDLGAPPEDLPIKWLAAPVTGLLVQPIIGYLSDRTWHPRWGRRRPFFLIGAILASITLIFVPYSPFLWVATGCLWILDASINVSMEPFRALVADKLNESQRSYGFIVQTLIIGIGTWIATNLPEFLTKMGVSDESGVGEVAPSVRYAFTIGAVIFISTILVTIFTTKEYPPEDLESFEKEKQKTKGFLTGVVHILSSFRNMNSTMKKLGIIQFFSWFAFFTMWSLSTPALTEHVYNSPSPLVENYNIEDEKELATFKIAKSKFSKAKNDAMGNMGIHGLSSMVFALVLAFYTSKRNINRKVVHFLSLLMGGLGFILMYFIPDPSYLKWCYVLIGFSWGSILSMPYAMLSSSIPEDKMGIYMGIFNMFIVFPQIIASLGGLNFLYQNIFGPEPINAMLLAGSSLIIAALACFLITDKNVISYQEELA